MSFDLDELEAQLRALYNAKDHAGLLQLAQKIETANPAGRLAAFVCVARSSALRILKKPEDALHEANKAIKLAPKYVMAYISKGNALSELGKKEEAIDWYDKAIQIDPKDAKAYITKGYAFFELGKKEEAIDWYDKAIEIAPKDAKAYRLKGVAFSVLGKKRKAIEWYDKAIQIDPKNVIVYCLKGIAFIGLGKKEEAIDWYDKAIEIAPKYAMAYCLKGNALSELGKKEEAIEWYDKAIQIDPKDAKAYRLKGVVLLGLGKNEEAIEWYDKAIQIDPKDAMAYHNKGLALSDLGKKEEAIRWYDKAIEIAPKDAMAYYLKGVVLHEEKNNKVALEYLIKAVNTNSSNDIIRGLINEKIKEIRDAEDYKILASEHGENASFKKLWDLQIELLGELAVTQDELPHGEIGHYRSVSSVERMLGCAADQFDKKDSSSEPAIPSPVWMCGVSNANDPQEGRVLQRFLGVAPSMEQDKLLALQTSFSARVDDLIQFRLYGRKEQKYEGTGVCIVFDHAFFADNSNRVGLVSRHDTLLQKLQADLLQELPITPRLPDVLQSSEKERECSPRYPLYWVLYYDDRTDPPGFYYTPLNGMSLLMASEKTSCCEGIKLHSSCDQLKGKARRISGLLNAILREYQRIEEAKKKDALDMLIYLRHLIKDAAFKDEHEARILSLNEYDDKRLIMQIGKTPGACFLRKDYHGILIPKHSVKRIIAGPKLENFRQLADKWQWAIKKQAPGVNVEITQSTLPLA